MVGNWRHPGGVAWRALRQVVLLATVLATGSPAWAQADEARARKIVGGNCAICHGEQGESTSELFPRLAGQHWEYIAKQLGNFKSGERKSREMAQMVSKLKPDEMQAVGRYFEKQQLPKEPVRDAALAAKGELIYKGGNPANGLPPCASCHGADALGAATLPRLAGQTALYTETQLQRFDRRERTNDNAAMQMVARSMTAAEMSAVAHYLESR